MIAVLRVSVLVPTYYRADSLVQCLAALAGQSRPADQLVVVHRNGDDETAAALAAWVPHLPIEGISIAEHGGVVAAMNAGLARCRGDIVAITDDDAAPRPDWLGKLEAHFADASVAGVGGRDIIWQDGEEIPPDQPVVGRVQWIGRVIGNHHLGVGTARDVDVLKGVNCAYRREALAAIGFDSRLRGPGAQMYWELSLGLAVRRNGWRLVYDPSILVDHFGAGRADAGRVGSLATAERDVADAAYNQALLLLEHFASWQRLIYLCWSASVGTRDSPGAVQAVRLSLVHGRVGWKRWRSASRGRADARRRGRPDRLHRSRPAALAVDVTARCNPPPSRPRVTLVAHDVHDGGGMERAHAALLQHLHSAFDITVVSATLADDLRPLVRWQRVGVPRRPFVLKFLVFFVRAGLTVGRSEGQLVHTVGAIIPNRADVATVHFCHAGARLALGGLAPVSAPAFRRLNTATSRGFALLAERWCYRPQRLRRFAPVSVGVGGEARRHYPGIQSITTPNGVDLQRFAPDEDSRIVLRRDQGIADQVVALFVGGDWDRKGLSIAIEATAEVRAGGADVALWIVGPGDEERFGRLASGFGCQEAVRFFGRRSDTERFYRAADVLLFPTAYEAFSLVMLEAAASGLPLVVPPVNGTAEIVGNDEAGVIVERRSASVAAALGALAADPERRAKLGAEARQRASSFTWERSAAAVADLYRTLLASGNVDRGPTR